MVATKVGGNPAVIAGGKCGILVEIGNENDAAEVILKLAGNGEMRSAFGEEGRKIVEGKFNFSRTMEEMEKIYLNS